MIGLYEASMLIFNKALRNTYFSGHTGHFFELDTGV